MSIKVCNIRLDKQHLEPDQKNLNAFLDSVHVTLTTSNFVTTGTTDYWSVLVFYDLKKGAQTASSENELADADKELYEALKAWRNEKAAEVNLKHYLISYNSELLNIALQKPKTLSALRKIKGFGEIKVEKYGSEILSVVNP